MFFLIFLAICAACVGIYYLSIFLDYYYSAYFKCTKLPYFDVKNDTGKYGEYLVYKYLRSFERNGARFLFNLYVPRSNGKTSEIDVIMLCNKGVFVVESKNYSGWIFGREDQKMWYQTLPTGRGTSHKEEFYNPVFQNHNHIRYLREYIDQKIPMWSIIAFSDRCTLKNVRMRSRYIHVINRYDIEEVVEMIWEKKKDILSDREVDDLYKKLFPLTQTDEITKILHVHNIRASIEDMQGQDVHDECSNDLSVCCLSEIEKLLMVCDEEGNEQENENSNSCDEESKIENQIDMTLKCPRCGNKLILRIANRGERKGTQFYGCSAYPKCRYIKNCDEQVLMQQEKE